MWNGHIDLCTVLLQNNTTGKEKTENSATSPFEG